MRGLRPALMILLGCALVCTALPSLRADATLAPAAAPVTLPATPMSSWGYWTSIGLESPKGNATKFLRQDWQTKLGTNTILLGPSANLADLAQLTNQVSLAKARGVGVILYLATIFNNGCAWNRGAYTQADYDQYEAKLTTLANALAPYKDAIVAIVGFDDMNGTAGLCLFSAPGLPNPMSESMRLSALRFPDTPYRGHIWQVGGWSANSPANAAWLENSTMLFPYSYQGGFQIGFDPNLAGPCPQQGVFPRSKMADSYAARNDNDLRNFLAWLNAQPGHEGTPVMFIANASQQGLKKNPKFAQKVACILTSTWYHMHCLSVSDGDNWTRQVRGFIGFAWQTNFSFGFFSWVGASESPPQKAAGKWIGTAGKTCTFSAQRDFEDSHGDQQYWRWRYEQCPVPTTSTLGTCTRLKDRDGDAYLTDDHAGRLDATSAKPPIDSTMATARKWTAPVDGAATIRLQLSDLEPSPPCVVAGVDDGARVAIFKDNTKIWPTTADWSLIRNGAPTSVTLSGLSLTAGTQLRFLVQRGTTSGATNFCDRVALAQDIDFTWR
jgi:hypothetical protein